MTQNPDYLFVYGTLRPAFMNTYAQFLSQHSLLVGETAFPGQLLDLGSYPGATYQLNSPTTVWGTVYNIGAKKSAILDQLDAYEGIGDDYDQPHEYVRRVIPVRIHNTWINCWVYLFNLSTDGKKVIRSGDYVAHSKNE